MTSSYVSNTHLSPTGVRHFDLDDDALNYPRRTKRRSMVIDATSWALHDWRTSDWTIEERPLVERAVARFLNGLAKEHRLSGWTKP